MGLNINEILKRKKELEEKKQRAEEPLFLRLEEGDNVLRFLPLGDLFYKEVYRHRVKGKFYVCPKTFDVNNECPICEVVHTLREEGNVSEANELSAFGRFYSVVVKKVPNGEQIGIISYGNSIWSMLASLAVDSEWGDFTDQKNGYAINIKRIGTGLETQYQVLPRPKKPIPDAKWQEWLSKMPDLDTIFKALSYEELRKVLEGVSEE
jgi:hypothetical protein